MAQPARLADPILPWTAEPSRNKSPERYPSGGRFIQTTRFSSGIGRRGNNNAGSGKIARANSSAAPSPTSATVAAHWRNRDEVLDCLWRMVAGHSYSRCQIVPADAWQRRQRYESARLCLQSRY
eukprot:8654082-Karenia_brevis.AAC.1